MSGQIIEFDNQGKYFLDNNNVYSQEEPVLTEKNLRASCMKEIERLKENMKNDGNFEGTPFSRAVLLFNAIKNLRRWEKKGTDFHYTPLFRFIEFPNNYENGFNTAGIDQEGNFKFHLEQSNLFFNENDAKGWLEEHGDNKKARNTKSKKTPNKNEDNKKAQKRKPKRTITDKKLPKVPDKVGSTLKTAWLKSYKIIQNRNYELGQHFDSQEFLIEVLENLLPQYPFLEQLKVRSITKFKIVDETANGEGDETAEGKWENNENIQYDWVIRIKKEHYKNSKDSGNTLSPTISQAWVNANRIEEDTTLERDGSNVNAKRKDVSWVCNDNKNILVMFPPIPTKDKKGIVPFVKNFYIEEVITPPTEKNVSDAIGSGTYDDDTDDDEENEYVKYTLSAVICHSGKTTSGGHYYAYVKRRKNDNEYVWYKCNDKTVTTVATTNIVNTLNKYINNKEKRMYMMMYSRDPSTLPTGKPVGLINYGSTCFANAAMQLLMTIPGVAQRVQTEKEQEAQQTKSVVKKKKRKTKSANPARPKPVNSVSAEEEYLSHAPYFVLVGHS